MQIFSNISAPKKITKKREKAKIIEKILLLFITYDIIIFDKNKIKYIVIKNNLIYYENKSLSNLFIKK